MSPALSLDQVHRDLSRVPAPLAGGYQHSPTLASRLEGLTRVELLGVLKALFEAGQEELAEEMDGLVEALQASCPRPHLDPSEAKQASAWCIKEIRPRVTEKAQYMDLVKATLPVTFPVATTPPRAPTASDKDGSEHQAIRDIERDVIVVNGQMYKAGPGGFALVVKWMVDLMEDRVRQVLRHHHHHHHAPTPTHSAYVDFAKQCLKAVNRTNSGGLAYDCLTERLQVEGLTMIVPDSKSAEPLQVLIDVCPFPVVRRGGGNTGGDLTSRRWAWGLCASLQGTTLYNCFDHNVEDKWLKIRARFRHHLYLPLVVGVGGACYATSKRPLAAVKTPPELPVVTLEEAVDPLA